MSLRPVAVLFAREDSVYKTRLREGTPRDFALWLVRLARRVELLDAVPADRRAVFVAQPGRAELAAAVPGAVRGRLDHRRSSPKTVSQLASATYRNRRDPEARRAYMRELMRKKRSGRAARGRVARAVLGGRSRAGPAS